MTPFLFMCFLHFCSTYQLTSGEIPQGSNIVHTYGLPELTRDILGKIKAATGQPIDINYFMPILATSSSKGYEVIIREPYKLTHSHLKKSKSRLIDGNHFYVDKGNENSGSDKQTFDEEGELETEGNELVKHTYDEDERKQYKYESEQHYQKDHHKSNQGNKGGKFKKGRKHGKFHVEKGFRDIYHKDEEKKADFFWNNKHEEGKWIEYGFKNRKNEKSHDKGGEGKKEKSKTEESHYEKKEKKCRKCKT